MAAAVLSKTGSLRRSYRLFSSSLLTTTKRHHHFSNQIPKTYLHQSDSIVGRGGSFTRFRFLSANANNANATNNTEAVKETAASSDSQSKHSEGSNQSSEQGKSVRGGPISWLSFLLLVATGAGVVYYYDQEKKRHIEGR